MEQKLYFVATPSYGQFFFLHTRNESYCTTSIKNYVCARGVREGVAAFTLKDAKAIIELFKAAGIKGSDSFNAIHVDRIFGFLSEDTQERPSAIKLDKPGQPTKTENYEPRGEQRATA